jgi:hypothetical protein
MLDKFSGCNQVDLLLDPFLDNELSKEENEAVSLHLAECKQCQMRLQETKLVVGSLGNLPKLPLPRSLNYDWDALVAEKYPKKQPISLLQWPAKHTWAAAALVASILLLAIAFKYASQLSISTVAIKPGTNVYLLHHGDLDETSLNSSANRGVGTFDQSVSEAESKKGASTVDEELLAVYPADSSSFSEEVGIPTDEDGLYALKL